MKPPLPDRAVRSAAAPPVAFRSGVVLAKQTTADACDSMVARALPSGHLDVHYYDALGRKEHEFK